jgi:hypothetical protein
MFGTIVAPAPPPPAMSADEWAATVVTARLCMEVRANNLRTAIVACQLGYCDLESYHIALAADWKTRAYAATAEARHLFRLAAIADASSAEYDVRHGLAWFASVACPGETCEKCTRPMWHHIARTGAPIICPFGREYWALARAIYATPEYTNRWTPRGIAVAIRSIATLK